MFPSEDLASAVDLLLRLAQLPLHVLPSPHPGIDFVLICHDLASIQLVCAPRARSCAPTAHRSRLDVPALLALWAAPFSPCPKPCAEAFCGGERAHAPTVALQGVARFTARQASQSQHPWAGSDGRANPLRYRRLCTDSPGRAASHTCTAGPWDNSCPQPVSGAVAVRYLGADMCGCRRDEWDMYPNAGHDSSVVRMTSNSHSPDGKF